MKTTVQISCTSVVLCRRPVCGNPVLRDHSTTVLVILTTTFGKGVLLSVTIYLQRRLKCFCIMLHLCKDPGEDLEYLLDLFILKNFTFEVFQQEIENPQKLSIEKKKEVISSTVSSVLLFDSHSYPCSTHKTFSFITYFIRQNSYLVVYLIPLYHG